MRRDGGFTFVELIVVLFILSFIAALAAPSFSRTIVSARLRASAAEVRSTLARARTLAVAGAVERAVVFDLEKGEYGLDNEATRRGFPESVRLSGVLFGGERGERVERGDAVVRFFPDGSAEEAEVSVTAGDGGSLRVTVEPLTGIAEAGT
ncbi:MAG: pilus assembly FimT family protein [Candidatus Deferrimicrobiaceae bacterium]